MVQHQRGEPNANLMLIRTTLTIPQPCHENWAAMTPAAQGRHCAACNKVVIDFTQKTDAEILTLLQHTSAVCGRFREDQLLRPLLPPLAPAPRWKAWVAATAALLGLSQAVTLPAQAQQATTMRRTADLPTEALQPQLPRILPPSDVELRGQVHLSAHAGVAGATIYCSETGSTVFTGPDGSFRLPLPATIANDSTLVLTFSAPGHAQLQVAVLFDRSFPQLLTVQLQPLSDILASAIRLGGFTAVATPVKRIEPHFTASDLWNAVRQASSRNP